MPFFWICVIAIVWILCSYGIYRMLTSKSWGRYESWYDKTMPRRIAAVLGGPLSWVAIIAVEFFEGFLGAFSEAKQMRARKRVKARRRREKFFAH